MLCTSSPGNYCFCKSDFDCSITIDFCAPRSFVHSFDVTYMIRKEGCYALCFGFDDFPGGKRFAYPRKSSTEIDDYLRGVIIKTKKEVLPYIEALAQFHVPINQQLYQHLAQSHEEYAEQFLIQEKIPLTQSPNAFQYLDDAIQRIRPSELELLRSDFLKNETRLLGIAATLGELIRMRKGQRYCWGWYHPEKSGSLDDTLVDTPKVSIYGLVSISGKLLYVDPLAEVLETWNHAELKGRTLQKFQGLQGDGSSVLTDSKEGDEIPANDEISE